MFPLRSAVRREFKTTANAEAFEGSTAQRARHEWRCLREFCDFAILVFHDRAALKIAIRRVYLFSRLLSAGRDDVEGVTPLFVRIPQAWTFPCVVWQHLTKESLCPFY